MRNSATPKIMLCILTGCALTLSSFASQSQKKAGLFAPDKGKFTIQLDGQTVGHEEFEVAPSSGGWAAHGTTDLKTAGTPATRVTDTLELQSDSASLSYAWSSHA